MSEIEELIERAKDWMCTPHPRESYNLVYDMREALKTANRALELVKYGSDAWAAAKDGM